MSTRSSGKSHRLTILVCLYCLAVVYGLCSTDLQTTFAQDALAPQDVEPFAFLSQARVTASDGAANDSFGEGGNDMHGEGVALSGNSMIVGAWRAPSQNNRGAAYVFVRNGTSWSEQQKLLPDGGVVNNDRFGFAVDIDGDTAVVGATGKNTNRGAVYVFVRNGATWTQQQQLTADDGAAQDQFGSAVAISGNTIIVGSWMDSVGANARQGSAFVFTRSGTTWSQEIKLTASGGATNDLFGASVALVSGVAVVGTRQDFTSPLGNGKAYVFTRLSPASWFQQQLSAPDGESGDVFGNSVAISTNADTIVVGAYRKDNGSFTDQGAAYVFVGGGGNYVFQQKLLGSLGVNGGPFGQFGEAVAVDGETIITSAPRLDGFGNPGHRGVVYVFDRNGATWTETQAISDPSAVGSLATFGTSVSMNGDSFAVSSPGERVLANAGQGAAYVFATGKTLSLNSSDLRVTEGNNGTTQAIFTVTLSGADSHPVVVNYATHDNSALSGSDYVATSGILIFQPGQTTKDISVTINGDTQFEPDEQFFVNLSNPVNANVAQGVGAGVIVNDDAAQAALQFSAANYSVSENGGSVVITVVRNGSTSGTATVDYRTSDTDTFTFPCAETTNNQGGAFARCDFATSIDTLTFAPGQSQSTFSIPIVDDSRAEGNETFNIILSNATGATLGTPSTSLVTIQDNETTTGVNPIFTTPFFVRQAYLDFLSREPELTEPWSNVLNNCSDVNNNPACDRLTVSAAFFGSPEFQLKGYFVYRFYKLAFNRLPDYTEIVTDMRLVTGQTPAEVFSKKAAFTNAFVQRQEFANTYGSLTGSQYVTALMGRYNLAQITTPDPAQPDGAQKVTLSVADLTNQLNGGTLTRAQVLRAVADSDQVFSIEFNRAFVAMQYYGYLRRTPDLPGYNSWLNYLNVNPSDSRTMVNGFMNSSEYRLRFGP